MKLRRARKLRHVCPVCYAKAGKPCWNLKVYRKTAELAPIAWVHRY